MVKVLVEFESWSVCETDDDKHSGVTGTEVYAEHHSGCKEKLIPDEASWGWEFDDPNNNKGREVCWQCKKHVPKDVVALVQLHNWGRKRRDP